MGCTIENVNRFRDKRKKHPRPHWGMCYQVLGMFLLQAREVAGQSNLQEANSQKKFSEGLRRSGQSCKRGGGGGLGGKAPPSDFSVLGEGFCCKTPIMIIDKNIVVVSKHARCNPRPHRR